MTRYGSLSIWLFFILWLPCLASAQDQQQDRARPPEQLLLKVRITDPDGHPIENATVFPSGLRTKVRPGDHWFWAEERFGPVPKIQTNAAGMVDLPYPKFVNEEIEVGTVTVSVEHPDFVTFREDRSVTDAPAEIQLKQGFRIAATAINASGESIKHDLYGLVSGDPRLSDWKLSENGMLVSPVFEPNKTWFRLIKLTPGRPTLFSELIPVDPADRSRVLLRDVKLTQGTRVVGRLDDSIPRPIRNGYVTARIVRPGSDGDRFRWSAKWLWYDQAPIAEDGSFVFESLPSDEILQMIPICDDWVPQNPRKVDVLPFYPEEAERLAIPVTYPQLVRLRGEQVEPVLRMEPATAVRVTVVDQNDQALPSVEVVSSPNQLWFEGGSQILGAAHSSATWLIESRHSEHRIVHSNRFSTKTDEHGIAILHSMPANRTEVLIAGLKGYEMPLNGTERRVRIDLKPDVVNEVTIKLQPAGTDVLKDESFEGGGDN